MSEAMDRENLFSLFRSVAEDYICLIDINVSTGKERQYFLKQEGFASLPEWSLEDDFAENVLAYADKIVAAADRERFKESTRIGQLLTVLQKQQEFIIEYDALPSENLRRFQGRFVLVTAPDGKPHIHVGIRDITETQTLEARSRRQAEDARYGNLLLSNTADRRTLLIVDDDPIYREQLTQLLRGNYNILEASNGRQCMQILREKYATVSLVLLAIDMPVMDGFEVLTQIKCSPMLCGVPVIAITDNPDTEYESRCLKMGATDFIHKPFTPNVVSTRVDAIIRLKESTATLAALEFDNLTGLHTRQAFLHLARLLLEHNPDKDYTLVMSDVKDFGVMRSVYGEETMNEVLISMATFLKKLEKRNILIGRYDMDIFVGLMETNPGFENRLASAHAMVAMQENMPVRGVTVKYGMYRNVEHDIPVAMLCERTLMALNSVKHRYDAPVGYFNHDLLLKAEKKRRIEACMRQAYEADDQFRVYYQPKIDTQTGEIVGAEALIRWQHPEYGFLSPAEFIPIFERNGFIAYSDFYVWRRTCQNLRRWMDMGLNVVPVSVNSSRVDFDYPNYMEKIMEPVKEYGVDPSLLHIEVTESALARRLEEMGDVLADCRKTGFRIELDDFGAGYSSLNTLGSLQLDAIKLDMSLVKQITDVRKARVLSACITLAKSLGLKTVAEGVETSEQLELLRSLKCDRVQGYYYSKPLSEEDFEKYLLKSMQHSAAEKRHEREEGGSGMYVIDEEYNVVTFNSKIGGLYPMLKKGQKCYKCLMNLDEPCDVCPVKNGIRGPQTYLDPIRNVYERVNAVEIPLEGGGTGHALILYTIDD